MENDGTKLKKIIGVEIQEEVYKMAKKSIKLNKLENKFEIINENILNSVNTYIIYSNITMNKNR